MVSEDSRIVDFPKTGRTILEAVNYQRANYVTNFIC